MRLTVENFFSHLILHPFESDTKKDKFVTLISSIACGILTIGICHLVCAIRNSLKPKLPHQHSKQDQRMSEIRNDILKTNTQEMDSSSLEPVKTDSKFWKNVTPSNIDNLIDVHFNGWCKDIKKNFFSIPKNPHSKDKAIYNCSFQCNSVKMHELDTSDRPSWTAVPFISVENNQFKVEGSEEDLYCDNFDQVLRYLFKGDFYHGEHFRADYYLFLRADGTEIRYDNPFKS